MIYRDFGKTGFKVSSVGMGTWNIGNQWGEVSDAEAFATVRAAFDSGINLFDTADAYGIPYGMSEKRLGYALSGIRHQVHIVGKVAHWGKRTGQGLPMTTPDIVRLCVHASLYRLRTDYIDVMLCHELEIEDPSVYLEAFEILKKSGEILKYGISTDNLEVLKRFNRDGNCSVVEVDYSLLNKNPEKEFLPYCQENGIAVLLRGPLAQGMLSGKYDENTVFTDNVRRSWNKEGVNRPKFEERLVKVNKIREIMDEEDMATAALRYVISHPAAPVAIPGAKSPAQAIRNAQVGDRLYSAEELAKYKEV